MARRIRKGLVFDSEEFDGGTASADVVCDLIAPSDGALIDEAYLMVKTAGVGTGTYDIHIKELGDGNVLTLTAAACNADAAAGTLIGTMPGNGVGASQAGQALEIDVVENGTVSTGTKIILGIRWIT